MCSSGQAMIAAAAGRATARERHNASPTTVLVLTMFEDDDTVFAAIQAGATGYLVKGADGADIIAAVRAAAAGQPVFGAALAGRLRRWFAAPPQRDTPFPQLTERELQIVDRLAAGMSNTEIGRHLHLSAKTIANNVSTILTKLRVSQRTQAIVQAREAGLGRLGQRTDPGP